MHHLAPITERTQSPKPAGRAVRVRRALALVAIAGLVVAGGPSCTPTPTLVDIAADVGLAQVTRTYGATVFDWDRDGWPDVLLQRHSLPARLYRNDHGRFRLVRSVLFPAVDRHRCAAGRIDGDARPDLFCAVGGVSGTEPKVNQNELWIQRADGTFEDRGDQPALDDTWGRGRQPALFDVDRDGDTDIFVGNASPRPDGHPSPNRLFRNVTGWVPAPELGLDVELSVGGSGGGNFPQGAAEVADFDGDGWTDLLLSAKGADDPVQRLHLFRNDEGRRFVETGPTDPALDAAVADLDGDGAPDIVSAGPGGVSVRLQVAGAFPVAYRLTVTDALRVALADADGDGHADVYVVRGTRQVDHDVADLLLLNRGSSTAFTVIQGRPFEGTGRSDDAVPIDSNRDGREELLVLNGLSDTPGPVRLLTVEGATG